MVKLMLLPLILFLKSSMRDHGLCALLILKNRFLWWALNYQNIWRDWKAERLKGWAHEAFVRFFKGWRPWWLGWDFGTLPYSFKQCLINQFPVIPANRQNISILQSHVREKVTKDIFCMPSPLFKYFIYEIFQKGSENCAWVVIQFWKINFSPDFLFILIWVNYFLFFVGFLFCGKI
jgi:hypothetical protein